jgi:hypothetical protein
MRLLAAKDGQPSSLNPSAFQGAVIVSSKQLTSLAGSLRAAEENQETVRDQFNSAKESTTAAFEELLRAAMNSDNNDIVELARNIDRNESEVETKRAQKRELAAAMKKTYQSLIVAAKVGNMEMGKQAAQARDQIDDDLKEARKDISELGKRIKEDRANLPQLIEELF